ncbi:MAG: hypothetical protein O3C63_04095 [Cyanobacteria bacterium]|nr:hypothetical protein [Cyanobacteriota bacterium]
MVLEEIIAAKRTGNELALQENTNQLIIEAMFDLVDHNHNNILEQAEILSTHTAVMRARRNQDLRYDINKDGIVGREDSATIYNLYKNQRNGIPGRFQIVH